MDGRPLLLEMFDGIDELNPSRSYMPVPSCEEKIIHMEQIVTGLKEAIGNMWFGVCLDCFQNEDQGKSVCRVPHDEFYRVLEGPNVAQAERAMR